MRCVVEGVRVEDRWQDVIGCLNRMRLLSVAEMQSPVTTRKEAEAEGTAGMDDRQNEYRDARIETEDGKTNNMYN